MSSKVIVGILIGAVVVLLAVWPIDVDVTGDTELPSVDVSTTGGELPAVDVNTADVEVGSEPATIDVPTGVDIETEEETVNVPTIDVEGPEEDTYAEEDNLEELEEEIQ